MKKMTAILLLLPFGLFAQKKSGVTYAEHPALEVIEATYKSFCNGDLETYATYFDPNVKIWSIGDTEPHGLESDLETSKWWNDNFILSISRGEDASPDVIQYKGDKTGVWVMDWTLFTAVNKKTGDTVKTWFHDEFRVNSENKITMWLSYYNQNDLGAQIQNSFGAHRNGRVYDEHPLIESVEAVVAGWVEGKPDVMESYFAEDAMFYRLGDGKDYRGISLAERKEKWESGINSTSERIMEVYGYPDAIRYEKGEGGWEVLSWWNITNVDKESGEEFKGFIHMSHSFNDERKISREVIWIDWITEE